MPQKHTQLFHIADILSIVENGNRPLRKRPPMPDGSIPPTRADAFEGVTEILGYMTGDEVHYPAIPRAVSECAPMLTELYPFLKDVKCHMLVREEFIHCMEDFYAANEAVLTSSVQRFMDQLSPTARATLTEAGDAAQIAKTLLDEAVAQQFTMYNRHYPQMQLPVKEGGGLFHALVNAEYTREPGAENKETAEFEQLEALWKTLRKEFPTRIGDAYEAKNYREVIQPLEQEHGNYLPVTPLRYYEHKTDTQELRDLGVHVTEHSFAPHNPGRMVTQVSFDLSAEEAAAIDASTHGQLAQAVYAIFSRDILNGALQPRDIHEHGDRLDLQLNSMDAAVAEKHYQRLLKLLPENTIQPYVSLAMVTVPEDSYVLRIDAGAISANEDLQQKFFHTVEQKLGLSGNGQANAR